MVLHLTDDPYSEVPDAMSYMNARVAYFHTQPYFASLLLSQYWSEARKDSFLDPTCSACGTGIDGPYIFRSIEGAVSPDNVGNFTISLKLYYNPIRKDNAVSNHPPSDPGYSFVRVVGYGLNSSQDIDWPTCLLSLYKHKVNGDYLTTCQMTAALQAGYQLVQSVATIMIFPTK